MSVFILSTMTFPVGYAFYETVDGLPIQRHKIMIHGGAGIASKRSGFGEMSEGIDGQPIWTAAGFVTPISEGDYERLKDHPIFIKHREKDIVKVISRDIRENHKEVKKYAAEMQSDGFRVLDKVSIGQKIKVTTQTAKTEDEFRL